jgi:hypothetical protein
MRDIRDELPPANETTDDIHAIDAAIAALPTAQAADQWRDIESAPKDGPFLVFDGSYVGLALVKRWRMHDVEGVSEGAAWVGQKPHEDRMSLWLGGNDPSDASHWMPLPPPPTGEQK